MYIQMEIKKIVRLIDWLCNVGCYIGHRCINSFMYADDIALLAISVHDVLKLVHICTEFLIDEFDFPINFVSVILCVWDLGLIVNVLLFMSII